MFLVFGFLLFEMVKIEVGGKFYTCLNQTFYSFSQLVLSHPIAHNSFSEATAQHTLCSMEVKYSSF